MVWWVDKNNSISPQNRMYDKFNIEEDRIFQSVNIMFNFAEEITNMYDVYSLLQSGVNIFNIDRTTIDESSYKVIKKTIQDSKKLVKMYQSDYYRPVGLSVTMSASHPVEIDKDVEFIILKNVSKKKHLTEFKEFSIEFNIPIFIWLSKHYDDDVMIDLVRASDGVVLDFSTLNKVYCSDVIKLCAKHHKPVFGLKPEISEAFHEPNGGKRKLFIVAAEIVQDGLHGLVINGTEPSNKAQSSIILNVVEAMRVAEAQCDTNADFYKIQNQIQSPQLVPMAVAVSATSAALTIDAAAIIILTSSGKTACLVSCMSPPCRILAITTNKSTAKRMHLYKKVLPLLYEAGRAGRWHEECRKRVLFGTEFAAKTGLFDRGAKLVVLAPAEGAGFCDTVQIVAVPFECDE